METRKFRGRVYFPVPVEEVDSDDFIFYIENGFRCNCVEKVTGKNIIIRNHQGLLPRTKRVHKKLVKECWRWHKKMEDTREAHSVDDVSVSDSRGD